MHLHIENHNLNTISLKAIEIKSTNYSNFCYFYLYIYVKAQSTILVTKEFPISIKKKQIFAFQIANNYVSLQQY